MDNLEKVYLMTTEKYRLQDILNAALRYTKEIYLNEYVKILK